MTRLREKSYITLSLNSVSQEIRLIKTCLSETYSRVSDAFPIHCGLKQGDALSTLLFNFAIEYVIRKAQGNRIGLKLNGKHQQFVYADDVNII